MNNPDYKNYAFEQIESFLSDLINDESVEGADIAVQLNKMIADIEDYHSKQLEKVRKVRAALFMSPLKMQQHDTRELLYEDIVKPGSIDLLS